MYLAQFSTGRPPGGTYIPGGEPTHTPACARNPRCAVNLSCLSTYLAVQDSLRFAPRLYNFKYRPVFRRLEAFTLALVAGTPNSSATSFRLLQLFQASVNISLLTFSGRPLFFGCCGGATSLASSSRSTRIVLVSFIFISSLFSSMLRAMVKSYSTLHVVLKCLPIMWLGLWHDRRQ